MTRPAHARGRRAAARRPSILPSCAASAVKGPNVTGEGLSALGYQIATVIAGPLASAGTVRNLRPAAAAGAVIMTAASIPITVPPHVALLISVPRSVQQKVNFGSAPGRLLARYLTAGPTKQQLSPRAQPGFPRAACFTFLKIVTGLRHGVGDVSEAAKDLTPATRANVYRAAASISTARMPLVRATSIACAVSRKGASVVQLAPTTP